MTAQAGVAIEVHELLGRQDGLAFGRSDHNFEAGISTQLRDGFRGREVGESINGLCRGATVSSPH